jgi:type IX secretion system PorP/SprF family membrane protein
LESRFYDIDRIKILRLLLIFSFLFILNGAPGQAVPDSNGISLGYPVYSQYLQNGLIINPAYAGSRGALSGLLSYRMQWIGAKGSPVIQSISLHTPMKEDKVALGIMAQFMQFGFTKATSIYASYAYNIRVGNGKLSFGLKGGADISNTDYTGILLTQPGDKVFTSNDKPYILPNVGAGLYYYSRKIFAGVSVPSFLSYKKTGTGSVQAYHKLSNYDFIFSGGGLITFSQFFKFKPSFLLDYSLQNAKKINQFDINGNFILADILWIGGSWRTTEEVVVGILQIQPTPQLMIGFSYDYPNGKTKSYSKGSTEIIIRYEFGYKVSAANPRYF